MSQDKARYRTTNVNKDGRRITSSSLYVFLHRQSRQPHGFAKHSFEVYFEFPSANMEENVTHTAASHQGAIRRSHVGHLYIELMIHTVFDEDFYMEHKPPILLEDLKATFDDQSSIICLWITGKKRHLDEADSPV